MPTVLNSLNNALLNAMSADPRVYLIGEDLLDPYGGAFKVSKGLSSKFPSRVITTPVSEAGIVGIGAGMALRGLRPVVEIMFGDFTALIADQIINHIAKYQWMYNDQVRVPIVIRTPMGGRRGYGPTHSQNLEKLYLGVPGLHVLSPCTLDDPGALLINAILFDENPVLFIENKLLYPEQVKNSELLADFSLIENPGSLSEVLDSSIESAASTPSYLVTIKEAPSPSITLATYGYMTELALKAALTLAYDYEVFVELIVFTQLAPFDISALQDSVSRTKRLLVVEEGNLTMGWGAEILARTYEALGSQGIYSRRLAAFDLPVPASKPLESTVLPDESDIVQSILEMNRLS